MGNTVTWSSSNTAIATVTGGTNSQVNVNSIANGTCNLIATITNSCAQTTTVTKPLKIGAPYFEIVIASTGGGRMDLELKGVNSTTGILENISTQNLTSILWEVVSINPSGCSTFFPTGTTAKLYYSSSTCRTQLKVTATNSCGSSTIYRPFIGSGGGIQRQALTQNTFQVFPNPAKDIINIELLNKNEQSIKQSRISAELYDMMGIKKSSISIIDFSANINVSNLKKGVYVLKIDMDGQIENHQVIIE
jgi:Secretion system C-terminal sorting domain